MLRGGDPVGGIVPEQLPGDQAEREQHHAEQVAADRFDPLCGGPGGRTRFEAATFGQWPSGSGLRAVAFGAVVAFGVVAFGAAALGATVTLGVVAFGVVAFGVVVRPLAARRDAGALRPLVLVAGV